MSEIAVGLIAFGLGYFVGSLWTAWCLLAYSMKSEHTP